jgi:hypothetical protein
MNLYYILKSLKKPSKTIIKFLFILTAAVLISCGKESPRTDYAARVNDSYLTEEELNRIIDSSPGNNFYRNEVIRNWVNREVLFQQAVDEGIIKEGEYIRKIEDSKKQLAAAMLLDQIYNAEDISVSDSELEEFFSLRSEEFRLSEDHFLLNTAKFGMEEDAIFFRNRVIETKWDEASGEFSEKNLILNKRSLAFLSEREIHPVSVLRVARELYPGEVSIVINEAPDQYTVLQLLQRYSSGTIPPSGVIKESLRRRFIHHKKQDMLKSYLKDLYSNFDIEIRQE